jgi:large subunit ribosomal protein L15
MAIKLHDLKPAEGSTHRRMRVGRGIAAKGGKTAGRGTKGQKARRNIKPGFEGGQTPLYRRLPKLRGFTNPFRVEYVGVNLDVIQAFITDNPGQPVTPETLRLVSAIPKKGLIKILGRGELTSKVDVSAHAFSQSASAAITAAGGTVTSLPMPFGNGRPAAKGNALTNR